MNTQKDTRDIEDISSSQLLDEEMTRLAWKRQYFQYNNEPSFGIAYPIILIGGPIIATIVIWLFVFPG